MSYISVQVESYADLTIDEVWPDSDGPEIITEADVLAVIDGDTDKHHIAIDWALPTELRVYLSGSCSCGAAAERHLHRDTNGENQ